MSGISSSEKSSVPASAWIAVALLMPVALLNYLDRQMLASMQASVMADIPSLGQAENPQELWGFMLGQFKWVYAFFSLIGGYVADRFSRRLTICGSLFVWSGVTWWTGQVTTYDQLIWARSLMGLSEAFYIPAALALIADRHTQGTRSFAVGLHQTAIYLGVIAGGFGGYVAASPHLGWRSAFVACGVFGMLYAIPLVAFLRDDRRSAQETMEPVDWSWAVSQGRLLTNPSLLRIVIFMAEIVRPIWSLLTNRSFLLLVAYFTLPAMAAWLVRDWMPAILRKRFELGEGFAGVAATLPWQLAAIGGAAAGGYLADRWSRTNLRSRIYVSAIGVGLIAPAIFGVGNSGMLWVAVTFLILFGLGWGFFDCNNMPILSQIVRPRLRATGYGIMNFVSISCGGLADWSFGRLEDLKTPLNVSFGIFACIAVFSIVTVLLIRPRPEPATEKSSA